MQRVADRRAQVLALWQERINCVKKRIHSVDSVDIDSRSQREFVHRQMTNQIERIDADLRDLGVEL